MNLNEIWKSLKAIILAWNFSTPNGEKIYAEANRRVGTDASPSDLAPDELGCAETVSMILRYAGFNFPIIVSTARMYEQFKADPMWLEVTTPLRGDIIISPTGMGGPKIKNGHVGIMANGYHVFSNASSTGQWEKNYNLDSWKRRWNEYPVYFFRRLA
jgi:hypothetical protein